MKQVNFEPLQANGHTNTHVKSVKSKVVIQQLMVAAINDDFPPALEPGTYAFVGGKKSDFSDALCYMGYNRSGLTVTSGHNFNPAYEYQISLLFKKGTGTVLAYILAIRKRNEELHKIAEFVNQLSQ